MRQEWQVGTRQQCHVPPAITDAYSYVPPAITHAYFHL